MAYELIESGTTRIYFQKGEPAFFEATSMGQLFKMKEKEVGEMKRVLLVTLVFMVFLGVNLVLAQDRCEVPTLVVGDEWTYKTEKGREYVIKVTDITGDGYLIKGEEENIRDKNTFNINFMIKEGKKEKSEGVFRKMLNFPLFVGKKWDDRVETYGKRTSSRVTYFIDFNVDKQENIVTPAGNFNAFRIVAKITYDHAQSGRGEASYKVWYSPQVKFLAKREYDNSRYWPATTEDAMLVKYKLSEK